MSQRFSGIDDILTSQSQMSQRTQNKNPNTELFKEIIRGAGVTLTANDEANILTQEQALVVQSIINKIQESNSETSLNKFIKGLQLLIKKEKYFRKALLPTQFKASHDGQDVTMQQESLIRILLKVHQLQEIIIDILLEEITSRAIDGDQDTSWLRLLLNQLRYLPHIQNPQTLTNKLLDIMEIATLPSQLEILDSIPEILPDSEYTNAARQLSKMLDKSDELCAAIIDCLNALQLTLDTRAQVQDHILAKILMGISAKTFAIFLEFLMQDYKSKQFPAILLKVRNALDGIMASGEREKKNFEKESNKIVVFQRLQSLTTTPKSVSEAWLTIISTIKSPSDHKPIDILILLMLHTSAVLKKRVVEVFFRKKIKDGLFKCCLIEQLFDKYLPQQLLRDYFASFVEIGCNLLRTSQEVVVNEFSSMLFKQLFNYHYTETVFRQELLDNLILLTGASDQKSVGIVLNIFMELLDDITKVQHHTVLFMRLLEKLDLFLLRDVKLVFEILCKLTCSDESLSGFQQELHMIIRKQLSSSKRQIKHRGIIAAVVMAKHIATTIEDQSETSVSEESILSVAHLHGEAKEAAAILELANTSTAESAELLGLYYDELASMLVCSENLDKYFLTWLFETITNDFQNIFVSDTVCESFDGLEFSMQFNLNSSEEIDAPIAVNIAGLCLKNDTSTNIILKMAPHFRLLRLLHYRHQNGDLSTIDALLGCGVILPKLDLVQAHNYDSHQMKQIADCVFHCVNWFREIISGFVTQKNRKLRYKVIQRLNNLLEMESSLMDLLSDIPDHKLPLSYFDKVFQSRKQIASPQKDSNRPRKKQKNNETTINPTLPSSSSTKLKPTKKITTFEVKFREIDIDIVLLLKYPLVDSSKEIDSSDQTKLTMSQLNFILQDFVGKLTVVTNNKTEGLTHLNTIIPENLIKDCVKILPNIKNHFIFINKKIKELLEESDNSPCAPEMFTEEAQTYKTGFGLILECLAAIFGWSGFQHSKRLDLLRELLRAFRLEQDTLQTPHSANRLIIELINQLVNFENHCLHLNYAVNLIRIMEAMYTIIPSTEIRIQIAKTSGNLLKKRWYNNKGCIDSGSAADASVDMLIKCYLSSACIKTICGLVGTLQNQSGHLINRNDYLEILPTIEKRNFYLLYRHLWNALHERTKLEAQAGTLPSRKLLTLWRTIALTMQGLMTIVKTQESITNLAYFLKKSVVVLKIFLSHGIPILELMLKTKPDEVVEVLKTIQSNTRFLHHLCCHSKLNKDTRLMAYVPQFRLTLETLVYRVKAALVANGCSAAFWMGNLKNRDLHGEDILSQATDQTRESEEELPEDEDADMFGEEDESNNDLRSVSEVYD